MKNFQRTSKKSMVFPFEERVQFKKKKKKKKKNHTLKMMEQ